MKIKKNSFRFINKTLRLNNLNGKAMTEQLEQKLEQR